tara:strand:+ start:3075 stop:4349 length:1275 start_codon:yes stop_codon:yes gene_type:complete
MNDITIVVLAAGRSTRFLSKKSKLTQDLAGQPVISYVYNTAKKISKNVVVVCNKNNFIELKSLLKNSKFIIQKVQKGTADAIKVAKPYIKTKNFIVLFGDVPLINISSIKRLIKNFKINNHASMIAFETSNPFGYGRVVQYNNVVQKVVEEINTNKEEKKINICNSGIMMVNTKYFFKNLKLIKINKKKNEKYITDLFEIYFTKKKPFYICIADEKEMIGINTIDDYNKVNKILQYNIYNKFIKNGVLIKNPETSQFSYDAIISPGVIIDSNVIIGNEVNIKPGTRIKSFSNLEGVKIEENCIVGPNARIRPSSKIKKNTKIGNFVEIKNSTIGSKTSISHLSYIGDSIVGNEVNIGAGTITCNYDGKNKNKTKIGNKAFIGSNCSLIAPIKLGNNVKIGAGSVINKNIPNNKLAIRRSKLKIY